MIVAGKLPSSTPLQISKLGWKQAKSSPAKNHSKSKCWCGMVTGSFWMPKGTTRGLSLNGFWGNLFRWTCALSQMALSLMTEFGFVRWQWLSADQVFIYETFFWNKNATLILNPADSFPFKERHLSLLWTQWTSLKVSVARQQTPWAVRRWVAGILNLPWWGFCLISIIHLIAEKSVSCLRSESEASSLETAGRSFLLAYRQLNDISMRTGVFSFSFVFNIFDLKFDIQNFASRTKRLSWVLIPKWHDPWINLLWILCGVCFASVLQNVLRRPRASMPFQSEAFCHVLQDYVLKLRALMIKRFFGALSPKKSW